MTIWPRGNQEPGWASAPGRLRRVITWPTSHSLKHPCPNLTQYLSQGKTLVISQRQGRQWMWRKQAKDICKQLCTEPMKWGLGGDGAPSFKHGTHNNDDDDDDKNNNSSSSFSTAAWPRPCLPGCRHREGVPNTSEVFTMGVNEFSAFHSQCLLPLGPIEHHCWIPRSTAET